MNNKLLNRFITIIMMCILLAASAAGAFALEDDSAALPAPQNVKAYPGCNSVTVKWDADGSYSSYDIFRRKGKKGEFEKIATAESSGEGQMSYRDTTAKGKSKFYYYITGNEDGAVSEASCKVSASCVRTINYKLTFRRATSLKSRDTAKKVLNFSKGEKVTANGFIYGYYLATIGGHSYRIPWTRVRGAKADYKHNAYGGDGDNIVAENFVNEGKFSSRTKYLIWISMYSQRLYVFKGSKGHWKCIKNWACNTGKASTPTITGKSRKLYAKYRQNSKHRYWSRYSRYSSIHGRNRGDASLGKPCSGGCVRIQNANAIFIMNKIPMKTRVISW